MPDMNSQTNAVRKPWTPPKLNTIPMRETGQEEGASPVPFTRTPS